jgi:hypothetical protein
MKTCSKCSISYDVSFFVKDKNRKDGLQPQCKSCDKEYRLKNKEHKSNYDSQYNQINKTKKSEYARVYIKGRLKKDNLYKLTHYTRHLIHASFKRACKGSAGRKNKTEDILGCSFEELMIYLKDKFKEDMSFDNYGKWHIDHIIPISSAKTEEEIIKLNHYTNFQPLWAVDNLRKSNKVFSNKSTSL